jgi:hypothetical protein
MICPFWGTGSGPVRSTGAGKMAVLPTGAQSIAENFGKFW